jgi:general secretion pathway protein K
MCAVKREAVGRRERGVVLIIVLWMVMLLSVIAAGMGYAMRTEALLAANLAESSAAYALAEAGVYHTIMELANKDSRDQAPADGSVDDWQFGGGTVRVSIIDESGRIDLNAAPRELLIGLLRGPEAAAQETPEAEQAGETGTTVADGRMMDPDEALEEQQEEWEALADAIIDWRDADDARGTRGAEARDYRAAGLDYEPRNANFQSIDELGEVLGMTPAILARVRPALTVYLHQSGINPAFASRQALLAVPGMDAGTVDDYLARREENYAQDLPAPAPPAGMEDYLSRIRGRVYRIAAEAARGSGGKARIEAVVTLQRSGKQPYTLLGWQDGELEREATPASSAPQGRVP